jgi:hypothetical protein
MELEPYVDEVRQQLTLAAEAGSDEARELAERLIAPLDAGVRLAVQHALAVAADEITVELAPGSVELRVRGRELVFVVTPPPADEPGRDGDDRPAPDLPVGDEGEMARINVRMPEQLKARVEQAAAAQHLSVNAWLVRAASAALDRAGASSDPERSTGRSAQRYRGWAK